MEILELAKEDCNSSQNFGAWETIFEAHIFPHMTNISDLMRIQMISKYWKQQAGLQIKEDHNVNWSELEKIYCKSNNSCTVVHNNVEDLMDYKDCAWFGIWRKNMFKKAKYCYTKHHGVLFLHDEDNARPWMKMLNTKHNKNTTVAL